MYLCYIDESGTPNIPGNTSHFILAGIAIPAERWKQCDKTISKLKNKYQIENEEIHTAWMLRAYLEQNKIKDFEKLSYSKRRSEVFKLRKKTLYSLQKSNKSNYRSTKKNYRKTDPYIHLTYDERKAVISELAITISKWNFARLFAECIDKVHFDPARTTQNVEEQAFEQVVSRFERYLQNISSPDHKLIGMLIHDNNPTYSKRLTNLMISFHNKGTFWTKIKNIIETPLFVDSQLTCMVQVADLCCYAIRRFYENNETELFNHIFKIVDKKQGRVVGIRHFSDKKCKCYICSNN